MIVLPRNPLLPRSVQPNPSQIKRKFSIQPRTTPGPGSDPISTELYNAASAGTRRPDPTVRNHFSGTHPNGKTVQKLSGPRLDNNHQGQPSGNSKGRSHTADYGPLLQESLEAARMTQESWLEDINIHICQQQEAQQEILRIAREERNRIAEEQRQIAQRLHQQQLEAHQTRLEDIARQRRIDEESRQIEAEERRRIAREWHIQAEQQLRDQELQLATRVAEEQQQREAEEEAWALQQAIEEAQRQERIVEAERQRTSRQRDCTVCMDAFDMGGMVELECEHWYCRNDFQAALEAAYASRILFQCCRHTVPIDVGADFLPRDFLTRYRLLAEELSTANPVYCSNRHCGRFIPPAQSRGPDEMVCQQCSRVTCRHCQGQAHAGRECAQDAETQRVRALATSQGWRACPSCGSMVEKMSGCVHMTCRCRTEFCYRCGQLYSICPGRCHGGDLYR